MSKQLMLFANLPVAVRPHAILNFEEAKWTRIAAELAAIKREHIALCARFLREAEWSRLKRDWDQIEALHLRIDQAERDVVAELVAIEHDQAAYVERLLAKIAVRL